MTLLPDNAVGGEYASRWVLHLQSDGAILVDKSSLYYARLSGLAAELLLQFSRARSLERVVSARAVLDNEEPDDVRRLLRQVLSGHPLTREWLEGGVDSGLSVTGSTECFVPIALTLQLTNGCNLTCPFCYASSGARRERELSAAEWIGVLHRMTTRGVLSVTLTGGEPTLAEGFREVLAAASGLATSVAVFSNGYSWSKHNMELVSALGNVDIQVSLDGTAATHDRIRGRSRSFERALATIRDFAADGVIVDVAMTASPQNFTEVYDIADAVDEAGATLLRVGQVSELGRAHDGGYGLTDHQCDLVNEQLERFAAEGRRLTVHSWAGCDGPEDLLRGSGLRPEFLVPGYLAWYFLSDGQVTPCQLEEFSVLGDIRSESVESIGAPGRLAGAAACAEGCTCMRRVQRPDRPELPFCAGLSG
jgi:sporulation killing factor system radical SAM maturase